ncbi:MAG TPA: hypothetical protein VK105_00110 [Virgibacillus sp.]|nr:hypothetical protein [Virgibacillus sp.]HLR65526.1 hypothetical protein [Virgibacillus sp.]
MQSIIISIITSLVVSLITFIVGLKAGKNQQDRAMKQSLYKEFYIELKKIKLGLEMNSPLDFSHYERKRVTPRSERAMTPVIQLEHQGNDVFLNKRIIDKARQLELDYFRWSHNVNNEIAKLIYEALYQCGELLEGKIEKNTYHNAEKANHFKCSTSDSPYSRHREFPLLSLVFEKDHLVNEIKNINKEKNYFISFKHQRSSRIEYSFSAETITIKDISQFINNLYEIIEENIDDNKLRNEKDSFIDRYNKLSKKVSSKAKDPESFWSTIFGAFIDIFKV